MLAQSFPVGAVRSFMAYPLWMVTFTDVELISLAFKVSKSEAKRLRKDCTLETPHVSPMKGWKSISFDFDEKTFLIARLKVGNRVQDVYFDNEKMGLLDETYVSNEKSAQSSRSVSTIVFS